MMIRTLLAVCFLLAASLWWSGAARADDPVIGVDGCAILASIVYTEVTEARLGFSSGYGGDPLYSGRNEITLCSQATRSVTSAFKAALQQTNLYVTWGIDSGFSGDYCLSHFLSQCYPTGDPAMPPLSDDERSFVMRSWQAVQDSVHYRMMRYPGSDVAGFRHHDLRLGIRRSLRFDASGSRSHIFLQ